MPKSVVEFVLSTRSQKITPANKKHNFCPAIINKNNPLNKKKHPAHWLTKLKPIKCQRPLHQHIVILLISLSTFLHNMHSCLNSQIHIAAADPRMYSPGATSTSNSLRIKSKTQANRTVENIDESFRSAQIMYDSATWRMYYRIIDARRRALLVKEGRGSIATNTRSLTSNRDSNEEYESDCSNCPTNKTLLERKENKCSLTSCSENHTNADDDAIFTLEL